MQRFFGPALILSIIAPVLVVACRAPEPVTDFDDMLDRLRQAGAVVEVSTRTASSLHLSVAGRVIAVNGENVLVFEYEDVDTAKTEAKALAGGGPGIVFFEEDQPPATEISSGRKHYYRSGRFILSYAGENEMVLQPMEEVFSRPFR
jgi:hypothetical protein